MIKSAKHKPLYMNSYDIFNGEQLLAKPKKSLNVLIVDDHPLICKGYTMILNSAVSERQLPKLEITLTHSAKQAYETLNSDFRFFDIVFLDIFLPSYPQKNIYNGEDIGKLLRKKSNNTRIIIVTSLTDHYRLQSILKSLNPEGLILKSEIYDKNLIIAVQRIIEGIPYYSPTILRIIKNQFIKENKITPPEREFLYLLSTGIQSKEIPKHLPWSISKVEKQKRILKEKLGVEEKSSWALIHRAKELGVI